MKYRLTPSLDDPEAANADLAIVIAHLNGWLERGLPQLSSVTVEANHYCVTLSGALPDAERDHLALVEV